MLFLFHSILFFSSVRLRPRCTASLPLLHIHHILCERARCRSRCRPSAHTHTSQLSGRGPPGVTPRSPPGLPLTSAAPSAQQLSRRVSPARRGGLQGMISEARRQISDWSGESKTMRPSATAEPATTDWLSALTGCRKASEAARQKCSVRNAGGGGLGSWTPPN